jgi:hypothetical protein
MRNGGGDERGEQFGTSAPRIVVTFKFSGQGVYRNDVVRVLTARVVDH